MKREQTLVEISLLLSQAKKDLVEVGEILDDIENSHHLINTQTSNRNAHTPLIH